ncbi:L,D-transpeptidase [Streptomyces sp. MNP-20]|uniref:L,D-transpeptidase n=1 Tax=Streptomyces sp. MNP-20 TaxID=2721165 RepID=UPI0020A65BFF|nr:L,D-transpeptidase [Streptomyces sp. MNP-20]
MSRASTGTRGQRGTRGNARIWGRRGAAAALGALLLAGCGVGGGEGGADGTGGAEGDKPAAAAPAAKPSPRAKPLPEALREGAKVNLFDGQTVGVGMPVSVTFARPVPAPERAAVEKRLKVTTDNGTTGSWSWVKDRNLHEGQRIDYRPETYWKPGTKITVRAGKAIDRTVTVGRSLVATVDVRQHTMTVVKAGTTRRVPITAGAPGMDTWNGTMVVSDKQRRVLMDSRTVGYGDAYKGYYDYAVHLTTSGTYLHQNPKANTFAGNSNVTHGCIGLATDGTAQRFYEEVIPGDVIRVTGSTETVAAGNGYGDWNVPWDQWKAGSAL